MTITQIEKSMERVLEGVRKDEKIFFLMLKESKAKNGGYNYVFNSKHIQYMEIRQMTEYINNNHYALVKIEED